MHRLAPVHPSFFGREVSFGLGLGGTLPRLGDALKRYMDEQKRIAVGKVDECGGSLTRA